MHCKSYFSGHCKMRGLTEDTGNTWPPLYMYKTLNERNYDGCCPSPLRGYSEHDKEMLKQTILEHEAIFRKQVYDLHRLYSIQKDLMEEFQKNGLSRFSTQEAPSKSVSYSSQVQSECSIRMLQMSHLHAVKSHQESKKARYMDDNVSSVSFFESNLQSSSCSLENKAQQRVAEPDATFRKCTKRVFDLRLPASVYIDDTDRSEEDIPHSSSLNTIPCFRICNGNPENKEKSNLASLSGCNGREVASNLNSPRNKSLFNSWADLNEPMKITSLEKAPDSFPLQLLEPRIQAEENHGHNFSLSSTNSCLQGAFPKDGDFDGRAFSNVLQVKEEISQRGPLCNNESAGECCPISFTSSISHEAKYHMFIEPLELKVNKVSSIISNGFKSKWFGHEQDFQISIKSPGYLESENSGKNTSFFPNSFSSPPKLEINATSLSLLPTWRKPSSDRNHALSPFPTISSFNGTKKVKMFCSSDTAADDLNGVSGRWQVGIGLRSPLGLENKTPYHLNDLNHGFQLQSISKSRLNFPFTNINLNDLKAESSFSGTQDELTAQMNKEIRIIDGKCEDFLLVPSCLQRKLASESLDKSRFPSQLDLGFSMDQGNERKTEDETSLHSCNLEVSSSILHARESGRHCNQLPYSFSEKIVGFSNFDMTQQNAASFSNQEKSIVDELKNVSMSYGIKPYRSKEYRRSNSRKYIDLNSRFPLLDDPEYSSEMPTEGHADVPSRNLGQISVSRVELEAPVMTPQEDNIPSHVECTPSSNRDGLQQELCSPEMLMKEAAESTMKLSLHGLKHMGGILCCRATTSPSNALYCFAEIILSNNESVQTNSAGDSHLEPPNDELDIFELMALQLEEMKPEKLWCRPHEVQNMDVDEKSKASLLTKPRRGQGKKRSQRKDFQKDILPGLATLSRQEVIKDFQTIGELLKASGSPCLVGLRRRNTCRNCSQTRQLRNASASITVARINTPTLLDNPEFDLGRQHMIRWGRKTRRCQSQGCPPASISAALI